MIKGLLTLLMLAGTAAAAWYLPGKARHHYSPTGIVYTTDYLTLHLPGGVVGFPPGSRLSACFTIHVPDKEVVTDGKYTLAVDPLTLTHDVEYAGDLADADQQTQDRTMDGIARRKAQLAANQHEAELVAARDIEGVNATMVASSAVGNYNTALNRPTEIAGSYGGGGGGYASGGGGYAGTTINKVTVVQNNFAGGAASRGGSASAAAALPPGRTAGPKKPVTRLSTMPMTP